MWLANLGLLVVAFAWGSQIPVLTVLLAHWDPYFLAAGRYVLVEQIGEGGMGAVWLAEQRYPVQRQVALKLIRPEHLYFPGARERFRREVEAVASGWRSLA